MKISNRINKVPPYLFFEISKKIKVKEAEGKIILDFGIGDPDMPTPDFILQKLIQESSNPINHRYPESDGMIELRTSIANWYKKRFGVNLNPENEVIGLIGG